MVFGLFGESGGGEFESGSTPKIASKGKWMNVHSLSETPVNHAMQHISISAPVQRCSRAKRKFRIVLFQTDNSILLGKYFWKSLSDSQKQSGNLPVASHLQQFAVICSTNIFKCKKSSASFFETYPLGQTGLVVCHQFARRS